MAVLGCRRYDGRDSRVNAMDLLTLATTLVETIRTGLDPWLCHPIGGTRMLKVIPLRILMAVEW